MTEVWKQGNTENGVTQNSRSVNISIAKIFEKINPSDKSFLKYVPDGFLNEAQKRAKQEALAEDAKKVKGKKQAADNKADVSQNERYALKGNAESEKKAPKSNPPAKKYSYKDILMLARDQIADYKTLDAPGQSAVRMTLRQALAHGMSEQDALMYARVSAHTGIRVVFDKMALGRDEDTQELVYADGFYNPRTNEIVVNPEGKRSAEALLVHELTHAIYRTADGRLILEREVRNLSEAEKQRITKRYAKVGQGSALVLMDEMNAHYAEGLLANKNTLARLLGKKPTLPSRVLSFFRSAKQDYASDKRLSRSAEKLLRHYKTLFDNFSAQNRANLGMEAVRVVGGAEDTRFAIKYPTFSEADISSNMDAIADMEAVATIDASKLEKTGKSPMDTFNEYFNSLGNNIASETFGDIALSKSSAKSEIRHGITAEKIASIEAIPAVIEQGKVIFHKAKEGGVERIVLCAPIKIGEADYYMGVMLQRDARYQRLYLHNVVSVAIEREVTSSSKDNLVTTGALEDENHLSITSIIQKALNVKVEKQKTAKKPEGISSNSDIRFALPEDDGAAEYALENEDISWYNEIKIPYQERTALQSEALTWDGTTRNVLRRRTLSSGITYRYVIDDEGIVHCFGKEKSQNIHEWRTKYGNQDTERLDTVAESLRSEPRGYGGRIDVVENGREQAEDDQRDHSNLRSKGRSDGTRNSNDRSASYRRSQTGVQGTYLKVVHTFTDLTGKSRNVLKVGTEYMIEGDTRSKYQPTIEDAVNAENGRIIERFAKKKDRTKSYVKARLDEDPDFLKGFRYALPEYDGVSFAELMSLENVTAFDPAAVLAKGAPREARQAAVSIGGVKTAADASLPRFLCRFLVQKALDDDLFSLCFGHAEGHQLGELIVVDLTDRRLVHQLRVTVVGADLGNGANGCLVHDDGVALHVRAAGRVARDHGVEDLYRVILGDAAGNDLCGGIGAVQDDLHVAVGQLISVRHQSLGQYQLRACLYDCHRLALGGVYAADLYHFHLAERALLQVHGSDGIQDAFARSVTVAVVLFHVFHARILAHAEGMDAVMLALLVAAVVDATARDDQYVCALADVEIVIHHIVHAAFGQNDRDVYAFILGKGLDGDINARFVGLGFDLNICARGTGKRLSILADVVSPLGNLVQVCYRFEEGAVDLVHFCHDLTLLFGITAEAAVGGYLGDQLREDVILLAKFLDFAVCQHQDIVRQLHDALLVRDDDGTLVAALGNRAEGLNQHRKAPQVNARFRLVIDSQLQVPRHQRGDLNALYLAARQGRIHLAVEVVSRAKSNACQVGTALVLRQLAAVCKAEKTANRQPLETGRLLKGVSYAALGAFLDREVGNVFTVQENASCGRLFNAHDQLGNGGFTAAVWAGDDGKLAAVKGKGNIINDAMLAAVGCGHAEAHVFQFQHGVLLFVYLPRIL